MGLGRRCQECGLRFLRIWRRRKRTRSSGNRGLAMYSIKGHYAMLYLKEEAEGEAVCEGFVGEHGL